MHKNITGSDSAIYYILCPLLMMIYKFIFKFILKDYIKI